MQRSANHVEKVRHSLAHLLAAAVIEEFPSAELGIGPTIEHGFYYDFSLPRTLTPDDLKTIEARMRELARAKLPFRGKKLTPSEARALFKKQPFKLELIRDLVKEKQQLSAYLTGSVFTDLCRGGHVKNTSEIDPAAFSLTKVSGAYWRGDEKNPQLQRIYGVAFESRQELEAHVAMLAEAERRDHKKLGPQLGLFMFHETAPGMAYWLPKGLTLLNELVQFWRVEHRARGYQEIRSPLINKKELYETSGHWDHYLADMFIAKTDENETYALKPMNCPNAMVVFGSRPHSYRELPLRLSDTDTLHRFERSGTLNGLLRVREFTQDDAHIFLREDQIGEEYGRVFEITERFYSIFNLPYSFRLGTRPKGFLGDAKTWNKAEKTLEAILKKSKRPYAVLKGDGAFYGPKVDILVKDSLGRDWQLGTIQLDFQLPRRFKLAYTDKDGKEKTPAVIHRVIYGSLERFVGILTEHFAGAFPLWIAPVQALILPVSDKHEAYAAKVAAELERAGVRAEVSEASETLGRRIREGELQKVPYILVVGDKEAASAAVNVRHRRRGQEGEIPLTACVEKMAREIEEKTV